MADREKLIELLSQVQYLGGLEEKIVDHLIANGVTVQKWTPKKELPKDNGDYLVSLVAGCGRYETVAYFNGKWWVSRGTEKRMVCVTHWMPLPEPPKTTC